MSDSSKIKNSQTDADLVLAARRGDKRAFVEIVARHQAMVCGISFGILNDFAASEDAAQEAFLTAWRKFHDLRDPARLRPWLAQIARNAALGHLRRQRGTEALDDHLILLDDSPTPDQTAATEEEAALVRDELAKLPENYRLPLVLFYREGQSVHAVAESLQISEDAVKQRLARGREMLRDRIAGVIETVLVRTTPSPVFTMTIAFAIGALTAPAVIAAGAFAATAATSAAAGSTSAASTTSIITAMSSSKTFLATAAAVAIISIPIGYEFATPSRRPTAGAAIAAQTAANITNVANSSFTDSALFAQWRKLHEVHGTNSAAMPDLYKAINDITDPLHRRALRTALIAEWVQVDATSGFSFFMESGRDSSQRRQFFHEWLAINPSAAVEALLSSKGWEGLAQESLLEIARKVPGRIPEIVSRLPKNENYWDTSIRDAFAILAEGHLGNARLAAETMTGPNRDKALAGVAKSWAKANLDDVVSWAAKLKDTTARNDILRAALIGKAATDPVAALEQIDLVPPGGREGYFADSTGARVLREAAVADFDATVAWIAANPGKLSHEDLHGLAETVTARLNSDPTGYLTIWSNEGALEPILPAVHSALLNRASGQRTAVWEWLKSQPENPSTKSLREQVLSSAAWQDPDLALKFAKDLPQSPDREAQMENLARNFLNGGSMLLRFENLYETAPAEMRTALVKAAFGSLTSRNLHEPRLWADRLSQLPESDRLPATANIARAWAGQVPEEAVAWASSLPESQSRHQALAGAVSGWAQDDPFSAAQWVRSLPAGPERDRTTESLVQAISQEHPQDAWQWALSIGDDQIRNNAAIQAAAAMFQRNPSTAQQWIDSAPIDPSSREKILSVVRSGAHHPIH